VRICKHIALLCFLFPFYNSSAQTDSTYLNAEEMLEDLLQEPPNESDDSNLYELIEQLLLNPIDINKAEVSELQQIPSIDLETAKLIVNHRKKYGNFFSVAELNTVHGLSNEFVDKIKPYLTSSIAEAVVETLRKDEGSVDIVFSKTKLLLRSRVSNDLQTKRGFIENRFEGTKPRVYNRLIIKYDANYQVGVLAEKDPGELSLNDFTSFHLAISDLGILYRFVLIDYLVEFGQGLAMWSPFGFSKGADAIYPVKKRDHLIKPYTSATETNFLRGAAAALKIDDFSFSAFYSRNYLDANIDTVTGDIISTPIDGFHRTQNEIQMKHAAEETLYGARIDYEYQGIVRTGILYYQSEFSNNFLSSSVFDLKGREFNYTSFYYDFYYNNINVFGEFAYNSISVASINSFQLFIRKDFSFITSIRSYPRNYISLHGYAFGERSGATTNEFGIYTGIKWQTPIGLINFYYDQFKFPFSTTSNRFPSNGDEFLAEIISKPVNQLETRIRYKYENKDINTVIDNTKQLVKRLRQVARFELIYNPTNRLRLKGRFEYNNYKVSQINALEEGYLFYQDVRFSPTNDFNFYARIIFFRTESFNSAIYEYENDLTGVLTNRALFGEGIRWYVILRYKPMPLFTLSLKYSETYKPKEETISSGLNEITGNLDNRIALQIDFRY
jgi:competence ComEA-like helix-hairpin-helix protein